MERHSTTHILKEDIISLLENEKWQISWRSTDIEMETAKLLNTILDIIINKIKHDGSNAL